MSQTITITTPSDLAASDREAWVRLQQADRTYESPYFHPGWAEAVDRARGGVKVAVVQECGQPVGFWPYEQLGSRAVPCGVPLSDYQGCIGRPGLVVDTPKLLKASGTRLWEFDHLLAVQPGMDDFEIVAECSPYLDLSAGYDAYLRTIGKSGRRQIKAVDKKATKLHDERGPLRLEADCRDAAVLDQVIAWKSQQYRETGLPDIFSADWTRTLLHDLLTHESDDAFSGRLSALWAGDQLAAAHFGLRSGPVVHWWFPTYDDALAEYSPGWQLLVLLAQRAEEVGIDRIDLGKGMSQFKRKAMSGSIPLREGIIEHSPLRRALRRTGLQLKERLKQTPLREVLRGPASWLFHRRVDNVLRS